MSCSPIGACRGPKGQAKPRDATRFGSPCDHRESDRLCRTRRSARRKTKKESKGLGGAYEFVDPDPHPHYGFGLSEREAMGPQVGRKRVVLAENPGKGVTGIVTRRVFTCGKCGREYPLKNETMLRMFVKAAAAGRGKIVL